MRKKKIGNEKIIQNYSIQKLDADVYSFLAIDCSPFAESGGAPALTLLHRRRSSGSYLLTLQGSLGFPTAPEFCKPPQKDPTATAGAVSMRLNSNCQLLGYLLRIYFTNDKDFTHILEEQ